MQALRTALIWLFVSVPCAAAVSPFTTAPLQRSRPAVVAMRNGRVVAEVSPAVDGSRMRVIVEFTTPPLVRVPAASRSVAAFAPLFARFRDDLARVAGTDAAQGKRAGTSSIDREYFRAFSGAALSIVPSQREAIARLPYVKRVVPDVEVTASDVEPGVAAIRADEVWSRLGTRGAGVTIAVIDSGVDYNHAALGGGFGPGFKVAGGYDFVNSDGDPMDDYGHGTHVAGIIAANSPDLMGVAPDASLVAYKVLDNSGRGKSSDVIAAIERAVDPNGDGDLRDHADVANVSLGAPGYSDDAVSQAVDGAVAAGVVFVVAAGNNERFQAISSPGTAGSAITVGASDAGDALASFSSKGPSPGSESIKPDVVAPGVDVRSAKLGGGTLVASGTSMATPHVSGAAALLRALHRDWTPQEVKSALVTTAAPVAAEVMAAGAGRIDAFRAATLTTLTTPSQLAFGLEDANSTSWSASRTIAVTNRGTAPRSWAITAGGTRDGIQLDVQPATLTLGAGESAAVAVRVTVDNARVPFPPAGSFSYSGFVELHSEGEALRIPWAFVKAARLRVRYADPERDAVVFLGGRSIDGRVLPELDWNYYESLVVPDTYSFMLVSAATIDPDRETTMIFRDDLQISGEREFDLSPSDAPYRLAFHALDESGAPLRARPDIRCLPFRFVLFQSSIWGTYGIDVLYGIGGWRLIGPYPPDIRTSSFNDRYTIFGGEACTDDALSKFYILEYDPIAGAVGADVSRTTSGELHAQRTRVLFPQPAGVRILGLWSQFVWEQNVAAEGPGLVFMGWPQPEWNGTVFLAKSVSADLGLQPVLEAQSSQSMLRTASLRVAGDRVTSFSTPTPPPSAYAASPTDPLEFGLGAVIPRMAYTKYATGAVVEARFRGQLGESINPETAPHYRLFDSGGGLVQETTGKLGIWDLGAPLRLEMETSPTYAVASQPGRSLVSARLGGTQHDRLPPGLTSLAILDSQLRPTERLAQGSDGHLVFSAIDFTDQGESTDVDRVDPPATKVWVRASGSAEWHPLAVTIRGEDFGKTWELGHDPEGTFFDCSLAEIAKTEGFFDLRIEVDDPSGNATETTLEPAFLVSATPPRTRALRR